MCGFDKCCYYVVKKEIIYISKDRLENNPYEIFIAFTFYEIFIAFRFPTAFSKMIISL